MERVVFLISKLLQLMIALCIVRKIKCVDKQVFIILDAFSGASSMANKMLSEFGGCQQTFFLGSRNNAFKFIAENKFKHLFVDSDVGVRNFFLLALLRFNNPDLAFHVYEEGVGTYRDDLYQGLKKQILHMLGVGVFFGSCCFVKDIYVFDVDEYSSKISLNKKKVKRIEGNLSTFLRFNNNELKRLFTFKGVNFEGRAVNCCVYLTDWQICEDLIIKMADFDGDAFLKIHPHVRGVKSYKSVSIIESSIPAELVLMDLMLCYEKVFVFDHHSSVRRYISGKNLQFKLVEASLGLNFGNIC